MAEPRDLYNTFRGPAGWPKPTDPTGCWRYDGPTGWLFAWFDGTHGHKPTAIAAAPVPPDSFTRKVGFDVPAETAEAAAEMFRRFGSDF